MGNNDGITPQPIFLTVTLSKGTAVIPAWILVLFAALFVVASGCSLAVIFVETQMMKEVRVMQIYEEDIENVLIRHGIATRSDFSYHPTK
jgi:hypothetical protein